MTDVQKWIPGQGLEHHPNRKIRIILERGLLNRQGPDHFQCFPIPGYNTTTYNLILDPMLGRWSCDCQGYAARGKCAHLEALSISQPALFSDGNQLNFGGNSE